MGLIYKCSCPVCSEEIALIYTPDTQFECPVCDTLLKVNKGHKSSDNTDYFLTMYEVGNGRRAQRNIV